MKYILLIVFSGYSFVMLGNELQEVPKKYFDLIHTELDLMPLWKEHQMKGQATLTLAPYFYAQNKLVLDIKYLEILKVESRGEDSKPLKYSFTKSKLEIDLGKYYTKVDTIKVWISYVAHPDSIVDSSGAAIKDEKGLYFINTDNKRRNVPTHLWTQGETHSNSSWFPTLDHPSEKHTQSLKVTYDSKYVSLSNGKLKSTRDNKNGTKTDHWVQTIPHSVYLTVLVIGDYTIVKDEWRGKEVSYYMEPRYKSLARPIFGRTPEMMEYFSKLLGVEFPWDKYSQVIVHDFTAGAMENTSAVTFNTMFQKDERELLDENDDETVAHELFHHWFGNIVTCKTWTHLTLNESFANYSEYLWTEYKYGKEAAEYHWTRDLSPYFSYSSAKKEPLIRYFYKKPDDMFDVISYNKGGKILHMLRNYLGDEAFFKSLNLYLTKFRFKTAEYSNLRQCFEEVSGEDLYWFFNQWYDNGGHPILNSSYIKSADSAILMVSQRHNFDSSLVYNIPMDLNIYTGDIIKRQRVILNKKSDTFIIREKDVRTISIDGTNSIVAVKNESREVSDWLYLLENSKSYIDQVKALKKLAVHKDKDKVKDAIFNLLSSEQKRIKLEGIKAIDKKWLKRDEKWNDKLKSILEENKLGIIKSAAIDKLSENENLAGFDSLIAPFLCDSSYLVENSSLKFLNTLDPEKAKSYAVKKIYCKSYNILNTAFEIIAQSKNSKDIVYFEEAISKAEGYKKLAIYNNYGTYIASLDQTSIQNYITRFGTMMGSEDEMDIYCSKYALRMLKTEIVKREDMESKSNVDEIDRILEKDKTQEGEF
jgi:aminopeptidase N